MFSSYNVSVTVGNNNSSAAQKSASKRRKLRETTQDDKYAETFSTFVNITDNRLSELAKRFRFEYDKTALRKAVWDALDVVEGLGIIRNFGLRRS